MSTKELYIDEFSCLPPRSLSLAFSCAWDGCDVMLDPLDLDDTVF